MCERVFVNIPTDKYVLCPAPKKMKKGNEKKRIKHAHTPKAGKMASINETWKSKEYQTKEKDTLYF